MILKHKLCFYVYWVIIYVYWVYNEKWHPIFFISYGRICSGWMSFFILDPVQYLYCQEKSLNKTIFFKLESGLNSLYPLKLNNIDPPYLASILTSFLVIVSHCSLIFYQTGG